MKYLIYVMVAICCPMMSFCQDITGLWKGNLYNDSTKQSLEYEIVISKVDGKLVGYSNTYYTIDDKQYHGIKKVNVRVAKDGKIVMQDAKSLENTFPGGPDKNVIQLNVLDLTNSGDDKFLAGLFVTNRSKAYQAFSGHMSVRKVNPSVAQSDLWKYLQKNGEEDNMTVAK